MTKPFTPFLTPDKLASTPVPSTGGALAPNAASEPAVTLKRDGDRITQIVIRCTCGQVIELACEY
ncbi:MAG TPA: hypothetical protein VMP11_14915 [Verrucomicrobiae bacterium]|nr:hypothetical protein [Verrucomicrobiae bacterium]